MRTHVEIASVPHCDDLVAEIWLGDAMIAEIQVPEKGDSSVEFFANNMRINLDDLCNSLAIAKKRLSDLWNSPSP